MSALIISIDAQVVHKAAFKNHALIEKSTLCGCFECCAVFPAAMIFNWTDNGETAKCPFCDYDTVVGDASGTALTKPFLKRMYDVYMAIPKP